MRIKQLADCSISINRFDTGECVNIGFEEEMELDDATAQYLLGMKAFNDEGVLLSNFVEV